MSIDKLDIYSTANTEGEWFINEDLDLAYLSAFASDSVHWRGQWSLVSNECSNIIMCTDEVIPLGTRKDRDTYNAFFEVSAKANSIRTNRDRARSLRKLGE